MNADTDTLPHNLAPAADWRFSLLPIADRTRLEREWRRLDAANGAPFFLSWDWIGCWLDHLSPDQHPQILRAERAGQLAALALLTPRRNRWLEIWPAHRLYLHETGHAALDSLTIEYNGILTAPVLRDEVTRRAVEWLMSSPTCRELYLSGIPEEMLNEIDSRQFAIRLRDRKPVYAVNLERIRTEDGLYSASLSANTRAQLRRATRQFSALGELRIVHAGTADEALEMLEGMIPLHQAYWHQRGKPGAFSQPAFVSFHRQLIRNGFDRDRIQFLRCEAGTSVVGYLYNFVKDGRVYAYQSGFDYGLLPRAKPGWLCHHLAIEDNLRRGMAVYDLLAGKSQFKASFAEAAGTLVWVCVERNGWKPRLMDRLRGAKRFLSARLGAKAS